ncbi:histidine kinase [bacterium SM23_57]|nr:MAG: histidine kinase [bacterium SM23_57]
MVYRSFRINCAIRMILIGATICLFFYLLFRTSLFATIFIVGMLAIFQFYLLFKYVEKTNRDLSRFLLSIRYSDFTQPFTSSAKGSAFDELNIAFGEVMQAFQRARMEKEEHFRYLQTVVQHVGIGLIAFKGDGEVELINNAAKRTLKIPFLRSIKQLGSISEELAEKLLHVKAGEKLQIKVQLPDETLLLSIYATGFILRRQRYTLVSLQNIQSELEEKEMESWQNLIRVLTHEIMNSITPISSLASTASSLLTDEDGNVDTDIETIGDVANAVKTIQKRSAGLINFVEDYRKLTRIPKPSFEVFQIKDLFERIGNLMKDQLAQKLIGWEMHIDPETLELTADPVMVEQVLINLCKNSVEAVAKARDPMIALIAKTDGGGNPLIQIVDNGHGISEEVAEKIFIPFFTTKKEGSGIGLSLSRQIMRLHRGSLTVNSTPDVETVFTLRF